MSEAALEDDGEELPETETEEEPVVDILTHGDPIRSLLELPTALVDECRIHFDAEGLHTTAVDPANVGMVDVTAHATGFSRFEMNGSDEHTIGLNVDRLRKAVNWARKRGDGDPVHVEVFENPDRIRVGITRPDMGMRRLTEWHTIDPETCRKEPEIPDLELANRADPDVRGFNEAISQFGPPNHALITRNDTTLSVSGTDEIAGDREVSEQFLFGDCAWGLEGSEEVEAESLFSVDYLDDMAAGLKKSKADRLTLTWGDHFPMMLQFEHPEFGFEGRFMLAPRIKSDGEGDSP